MALALNDMRTLGTVEMQIYDYVTGVMKYNPAVACGIIANAGAESSFNPTAVGDGGKAYGLFQWRDSRLKNLHSFCKNNDLSVSLVSSQLEFLFYELGTTERNAKSKLSDIPNSLQGAYSAGYNFCYFYERPSNKVSESDTRGKTSQTYYTRVINNNGITGNINLTLGDKIVEKAREQVRGNKPIKEGAQGPNAFDGPGLICYCYNEAGFKLPDTDLLGYYLKFSEEAQQVYKWPGSPGDIIFTGNTDRNIIGIVTGSGGYITASSASGATKVSEIQSSNLKFNSFTSIYRILEKSQTTPNYETIIDDSSSSSDVPSSGGTGSSVNNGPTYSTNISINSYDSDIAKNLSRVIEAGFDLGYLIDMTNGGEFKFYIPEFSELAGANWSNVDIIGRSVSILSYESTNSRVISLSLDLYAGEGVYKNTTDPDPVGLIHKDANFLKSLEYPDYQNPITRPPAMVNLILGSTVNIMGVISDVSVEHKKPVDSQNRSMYLKVGFKITQAAQNPPDWKDIRYAMRAAPGTRDVSSIDIDGTAGDSPAPAST